MCVDDPLGERESQADTTGRTRATAFAAPERLEHVRQLVGRKSDTGVSNQERDVVTVASRSELNRRIAIWRVLVRVLEQVVDHATKQDGVDIDIGKRLGERDVQRPIRMVALHSRRRLVRDLRRRNRGAAQRQRSGTCDLDS